MGLPLKRGYEGENMGVPTGHSRDGVECHSNVEMGQYIHVLDWKEHD